MAGRSRSKGKLLVPECGKALNQWKYEFAAELGLSAGQYVAGSSSDTEFGSELGTTGSGPVNREYWGEISSREAGSIGGSITRRLIQQAEQALRNS